MTQEEKQLLLKDLCARLPYGVEVNIVGDWFEGQEREPYDWEIHYDFTIIADFIRGALELKPYLRPMASMTDAEKEYLIKNYRLYYDECSDGITNGIYSAQFNRTIYEMINERDISDIIDWLNEHHFDYRGLIDKGLALKAPEGMYNNEPAQENPKQEKQSMFDYLKSIDKMESYDEWRTTFDTTFDIAEEYAIRGLNPDDYIEEIKNKVKEKLGK